LSDRFLIPHKLFGREVESAALFSAFERVVATGTPELVLVSGYSGIGKSALVQELHKPVVQQRGLFVSGKFEPLRRNIPHLALVQICRELVYEILAESEERLGEWKQRLQDNLEHNGQVIVTLIPEVELLIGPQPPAPELPPSEAENRL